VAGDGRIATADEPLVGGDDHRQQGRVLDRLDRARLVQQAVAVTFGERGSEDVVDAGVVPQVEGASEPRRPQSGRRQDQNGDGEPVGAMVRACRG
jgi:hypothetical protein